MSSKIRSVLLVDDHVMVCEFLVHYRNQPLQQCETNKYGKQTTTAKQAKILVKETRLVLG
jgi:hypothetical protein